MKGGVVKVFTGLPGFETLREFLIRNACSVGTIVLTSRPASAVHARTIIESEDSLISLYESGGIEIQELGELVRALASHQGLPAATAAGDELQRALIASVVRSSHLDYFAPAVDLPGFYSLLVRTARELRHARIHLSSDGRSAKLKELAELIAAFEDRLKALGFTTLSDRIEQILCTDPKRPSGLKKILWIGEPSMPELWLAFAEWLRRSGLDVIFLVESHPDDPNFYPTSVVILKRWRDAEIYSIERSIQPHHLMFSEQRNSFSSDSVDIMESADEYIEAEWAIRQVMSLVESGVSPKKICFYVREGKDTPVFLQIAAKRFGVRLQFRHLLPLSENSFARQWQLTLSALSEGSIEKVAQLMLSSYSGLSYFERKQAYDSVLSCLRSDHPWSMLSQLALDDNSLVPAWVAKLDDWRVSAQSPGTLGDWINRLDQLISETPWLDNSVSSDFPTHSRDVAAQDKLIRSLLFSRLSVDPDLKLDLRRFVEHAKSVWDGAKYWVTHHGDFRVVFAGEAIGDADYVIALGLVEGTFPRRRKDDAILSDSERVALNKEYGNRLELSIDVSEKDRQEFHRLLCSSKQITLSYPLGSGDHSSVRSSFIDDYLAYDPSARILKRTYSDRFPRPEECLIPQDRLASSILHGCGFPKGDTQIDQLARDIMSSHQNSESIELSDEEVVRVVSMLPSAMSLNQLTSANECLFRYVMSEKLRLSDAHEKWRWGRIARIVRSTDVVSVSDPEALYDRVIKACETYLKDWRGRLSSEELSVLNVVLPSVLQSFVELYNFLVSDLGLQPYGRNVGRSVAIRRALVSIRESIDLLFLLDSEEVPLKFRRGLKDRGKAEAAALLSQLAHNRSGKRSALFFDISKGSVSVYTDDPRFKDLPTGDKQENPVQRVPWNDIESLVDSAIEDIRLVCESLSKGDFEPNPGDYCRDCGFGSLCRRPFGGSPHRKVVGE